MPDDSVSKIRPTALLLITTVELFLLVTLLLAWHFEWFHIDELPQEIGGVLPLIVPWGGALGGLAIAFVGLASHWPKWAAGANQGRQWNAWYLVRPLVGATMGSIAALIVVLFLGTIGSTDTGEIDTSPRGAATLMVIAFVVGYRQSTFAELVSRVVDVILSPGQTTQSVGYSISPTELKFATAANTPQQLAVNITNEGTGLLRTPRAAFTITGADAGLFSVTQYPGNVRSNGAGSLQVTYTPTSQGTHKAELKIDLESIANAITLDGTAS